MARKMKPKETNTDPLESVADFDPDTVIDNNSSNALVSTEPISPLGPPTVVTGPGTSSIELLLQEANRRIEQLQADLIVEREQKRELERKYYQLEATAAQAENALDDLKQER